MNKKNRKASNYILGILVVMILTMSVGFAVTSYTRLLTVNGSNVTVKAAKWSVHYDETTYVEKANSVQNSAATPVNDTTFVYNVELYPGDFYEAEVDVVNDGTFDAELTGITMGTNLTETEKRYLNYYFTYEGVEYRDSHVFPSGSEVRLNKDSSHKVKIHIDYFTTLENESILPDDDHDIALQISLAYRQVD